MDNPFSDIWDNADDIFESSNLSLPDLRTPSPELSDPFLPSSPPIVLATPKAASNNSMPLPPEGIFGSEQDLEDAIQKWAAQHKFAFIKRRSQVRNQSGRKKCVWYCNRHGEPR